MKPDRQRDGAGEGQQTRRHRQDFISSSDLSKQAAWSRQTFGPDKRLEGVLAHIAKELDEVRAMPEDPYEWADLLVLAIDGATRQGIKPERLIAAYHDKMQTNYERTWPDWREFGEHEAIEHVREVADE